jgi:hypothetical protein
MRIDNESTVSVPVDRAWEVLTDLEGVSLCLLRARLTGRGRSLLLRQALPRSHWTSRRRREAR